ncbi:MAG: RidA family protein [Proteobacteria bacterium]|nr:RidA family protein [Pseudomonadota bacterium]
MIETRLQTLGIELPVQSPSTANYVPFVKTGTLIFISGQLPAWNGELKYIGKVGLDFSLEDGREAARLCALNILSHLKIACEGDLNRIKRCVRLGGFVNSTDTFKDHPKVINGASDLMIDVFEEEGRHARMAVGVNSLPLGSAVEVEALFEMDKS